MNANELMKMIFKYFMEKQNTKMRFYLKKKKEQIIILKHFKIKTNF